MAEFSWKRLRQSIIDVATLVEKGQALVIRVLAWLSIVGLSALSFLNADTLLPPTMYGRVLWATVVLAALVLGVQAVYRVRSEIDMPPMAPQDFALMVQMRQLAGRVVGMFGFDNGQMDRDGLRKAIEELRVYRYTLRHHGQLDLALRRYTEALEHWEAESKDMSAFERVDVAEKYLHEVCRKYEISTALGNKTN